MSGPAGVDPAGADPAPCPLARSADSLHRALLGAVPSISARDIARRSGVSPAVVWRYWQTLGLPRGGDDEIAFTEADAEAFAGAAELVSSGAVTIDTAGSLVRALGHLMDRLVLWQVEALAEGVARTEHLDQAQARLAVIDRLDSLAPVLEAQLDHAYRRHLTSLAVRYELEFGGTADRADDAEALPLPRAVGFADMVSFTRRTAGLGATDLSDFVHHFESAVRDVVVECGGRVVKTIGDAVLFVADDVRTGAVIALELARVLGGGAPEGIDDGITPADVLPSGITPVRVGVVWGRVLSRHGDVFGPSVNLAARLTDIADPSTVLTDPATAALLAEWMETTPLPTRDLAGIGQVTPVRIIAR